MKHLYHYYEKTKGPFLTVTELPYDKAFKILTNIKAGNPNLVNPNIEYFLKERYRMEKLVRNAFIAKGGKPQRKSPIYMTLGENHHMNTWYTQPEVIKINVSTLDLNTVSFTYGDMFPIFNPELDMGEEYRNTIYSYDEILKIIDKYGYPEDIEYSVIDRVYPMERPINHYLKYIEAQVWSNDFITDLKI